MLPGYNGRNKTFFLVNYEGTRIDRGATNFYTVPTPDELAGRFSTHDHRSGDRPAVPEQHHSAVALLAARAAGASENNWSRRRTPGRRRATIQAVRTCPQVQDQFTIRGRPGSRLTLGRGVRPLHADQLREHDAGQHDRPRATASSCRTRRTGRCRTAGRSRNTSSTSSGWATSARGRTSTGSRARRRTSTSSGRPACSPAFPTTSASIRASRMQRVSPGTGGAVNDYKASNQPMWDISNTTTWVTGRHTLNFGANYRRWWLQRDLANDFLGNYAFNAASPATPSPTCCSGTTRASASSSRRPSACRARPAIRASSTSSTSRRTCRTTGGQLDG